MKQNLHPKFNIVEVICNSCKNKFMTGTNHEGNITVEVCSNCHPFYTGKHRIVDTENLVKKFEKRAEKATKLSDKLKQSKDKKSKRKSKVDTVKGQQSLTLKDMLKEIQG